MGRWLSLVAVAILAGCSPSVPKGVIVTGKITKGGAPLTIPEGGAVDVTIFSTTTDADGYASGASEPLKEDGTFRLIAGGKGVPPGKYRLQLQGNAGPGEEDVFSGAFSEAGYVKEFDVPADRVGGEFDLGTIELNDVQPSGS